MPRRTVSTSRSAPSNSITESLFSSKQPPPLPRGLPADVRVRAKELLAENVHLWDPSQLEGVIRLAKLQLRFSRIEARVREDGEMIEHEKRGLIAHPLIGSMSSISNSLVNLQRSLGISFASRGNNVKREESKAPTGPTKIGRGKATLRLA